jgi:hypothetical protein
MKVWNTQRHTHFPRTKRHLPHSKTFPTLLGALMMTQPFERCQQDMSIISRITGANKIFGHRGDISRRKGKLTVIARG